MNLPLYSAADLAARHEEFSRPWHKNYLAMYSSQWGGLVTDPVLMTVPIDDHLVHRADGVFDVFKCVNGLAYCFKRHMERLERSAAAIGLVPPPDFARIEDIVRAAVRAGGRKDVTVRIMVSRGPGGFTTNPYECPASQLYVMVTVLKNPPPEAYERGVSIVSAPVPIKHTFFANIKSCDYLGNVLIKKAAVEAGVDYAMIWDEQGYLAEGSNENILLVSPDRELLTPEFDRVLKGVTARRVMELAENLVREKLLSAIRTARIDRPTAADSREVFLSGTTLDVLPVSRWDDRPVGDGRPGPVARRLLTLMRDDMARNPEVTTPMFD
ncbi:MAG: aminotransferase class IV [Thermodesulfobacteriota bacterium]